MFEKQPRGVERKKSRGFNLIAFRELAGNRYAIDARKCALPFIPVDSFIRRPFESPRNEKGPFPPLMLRATSREILSRSKQNRNSPSIIVLARMIKKFWLKTFSYIEEGNEKIFQRMRNRRFDEWNGLKTHRVRATLKDDVESFSILLSNTFLFTSPFFLEDESFSARSLRY